MSDKKSYKTVAIIGGGLIGTSLSLSIKKNNLCDVIKVYDSNIQVRKKLKERLSPNEIYESLEDTVFDADLVVLCIPVGSMKEVAKSISKLLKDGCILTDTGSTKNSVIKDVKPYISQNIWFIPSHPLAGTENSGPEAGLQNFP